MSENNPDRANWQRGRRLQYGVGGSPSVCKCEDLDRRVGVKEMELDFEYQIESCLDSKKMVMESRY